MLALPAALCAQSVDADGPTFEAATVRENRSAETRTRIEVLPSGQFNAINMTLRQIVSIVYPTAEGRFRPADQLDGGPGWFDSLRFDIIAKSDARGGDSNKPALAATAADRDAVERVRLMMRRLLADRFKLRVHNETRQLPIYELLLLKRSELGPDMKRATIDCLEEWKNQGTPDARNLACGSLQRVRPGSVRGHAVEIGPLVGSLFDWAGRPVVDRTGLTGRFDFTLNWAPESSNDTEAPSIFTALQEQLGLKLQPARGPVDVLVVDSAERPTPD
jgi:uncharacterized protein (TIGR03435 family)